MFVIEYASELYSQVIWEWRNDEVTRSVSGSTDLIPWKAHDAWFKQSLDSPERFMYIGIQLEDNGKKPIGVIRFDLVDAINQYYELSINVAPLSRGQGFGKLLLALGTKAFMHDVCKCSRIYAKVKASNVSSNSFFSSAGYSFFEESSDKFITYCVNLP